MMIQLACGWRGEWGAPPRAAGVPTPGGGASTVGLFATTGPARTIPLYYQPSLTDLF
jgi:hypothetical protein